MTLKKFYQDVGLAQDPNKRRPTRKASLGPEFVQKLEAEASKPQKKRFKFGKNMCEELEYYINKYGDDYNAMARDKKNIYQDSAGQLRFIRSSLREQRVVSKPQLLSRLRYVKIVRRCDETEQEKAYRTQYESLQQWNNNYWAENNELFNREKQNYIRLHFGDQAQTDDALSHDQLAPFYRSFLEQSRSRHVRYNRVWYKNHGSLLVSSLIAKTSRLKADIELFTKGHKN